MLLASEGAIAGANMAPPPVNPVGLHSHSGVAAKPAQAPRTKTAAQMVLMAKTMPDPPGAAK